MPKHEQANDAQATLVERAANVCSQVGTRRRYPTQQHRHEPTARRKVQVVVLRAHQVHA